MRARCADCETAVKSMWPSAVQKAVNTSANNVMKNVVKTVCFLCTIGGFSLDFPHMSVCVLFVLMCYYFFTQDIHRNPPARTFLP